MGLYKVVYYFSGYLSTLFFGFLFIIPSLPRLIMSYFKKKVKFNEPPCVNDPKIGTHSNLVLLNQNYKIHYVSNGEKGKPLILFLHGFLEFWYSWRFQLPEFGKDHFAVAIDLLGYGKSSKPTDKESYSFKNIALLINDIVHELGYEECILVGHDWGTLIAYEVAAGKMYV